MKQATKLATVACALAVGVMHPAVAQEGGTAVRQPVSSDQPNPHQARPRRAALHHAANNSEDVVVTARRRSERAQTTPISVTAFSSASLARHEVRVIQDLDTLVPGFRFASDGGKNTNDVVLRGLARIPLGLGIPAVVTYFADVPLPGIASNVPTFDLNSIQVLKGPQGTLFGRNTLGGAVLLTPVAPSDQFGGYLDGQVGNLGRGSVEGAVNIPIVADKVDLRVAGQLQRGDGYIKNLNGGGDYNNTNLNSYRVSLLIKPTDYIRNTFIYDYTVAPEHAAGAYLLRGNAGIFGQLFSPAFGPALGTAVGNSLDGQVAKLVAIQHAAGTRAGFSDVDGGNAFRRLWGITNDTRVDLSDEIEVRNIVGLRKVYSNQLIDTGGVPTLSLLGSPFTLLDASEIDNQEYLTEEAQVLGKFWHDRLNLIVGTFYNNDWTAGPAGSQYTAFGATSPATTSQVKDHNIAGYAQGSLDLSQWILNGLTLNLGYRYSWDHVHACAGAAAASFVTSDACEAAARRNIPGGAGDINASGSDPSWTLGLDYKLSDNQFFYVTSRRGYRGVNVNTPLFTSPFTTGGINPLCTGAGNRCPDLRPFQTTGPEKLTDVEIGSKTIWKLGRVSGLFDIAGFWSKYDSALQFLNVLGVGGVPATAPDAPADDTIGVNAADETIEGVEVNAIVRPSPDITVTLNGAYTYAHIDSISSPSAVLTLSRSDITLPSPRFSGSLDVRWQLPVHPLHGNLVLSGDVYATSKFGAQQGIDLPGYAVGNARIDLMNFGPKNIDVGFFVKNIADRRYLLSASVLLPSYPINTAFFGEPRTVGLDLRYLF